MPTAERRPVVKPRGPPPCRPYRGLKYWVYFIGLILFETLASLEIKIDPDGRGIVVHSHHCRENRRKVHHLGAQIVAPLDAVSTGCRIVLQKLPGSDGTGQLVVGVILEALDGASFGDGRDCCYRSLQKACSIVYQSTEIYDTIMFIER